MDMRHFEQNACLLRAVVVDGFMFLSSMVPENTEAGVKDQTQGVLAQINHWLKGYGSSKAYILETAVSLVDMDGYAVVNRAWGEWVTAGHAPTQACVQVELTDSRWAVKIKVSAVQAV